MFLLFAHKSFILVSQQGDYEALKGDHSSMQDELSTLQGVAEERRQQLLQAQLQLKQVSTSSTTA